MLNVMFTSTELSIKFVVCKTVFVYQDRFVIGATLLDDELQRRAESVLTGGEETELDFNTTHTER